MSKVISGVTSIERKDVDILNNLQSGSIEGISTIDWAGMSICAVIAHLVECSDKEEVQSCLDLIVEEK